MNPKEFLRFKMKVAEAARATMTEADFVHALEGFVKRGQRLLNGDYKPPTEREVEDGDRGFGRFVSDQKVIDFCTEKGIVLNQMHKWWWYREQRQGEVRDLPTMRGFARITNGMVLYLEDSAGQVLLVHNDNFKFDRKENDGEPKAKAAASRKTGSGLSRAVFAGLLE